MSLTVFFFRTISYMKSASVDRNIYHHRIFLFCEVQQKFNSGLFFFNIFNNFVFVCNSTVSWGLLWEREFLLNLFVTHKWNWCFLKRQNQQNFSLSDICIFLSKRSVRLTLIKEPWIQFLSYLAKTDQGVFTLTRIVFLIHKYCENNISIMLENHGF